ncbi:telomerase-binding protein EST1A [Condylostylus longicornis]|uniref:telomerase-binding protein EST1A n=1 Tax=Condylostylus longicornis TaxID=2530218 RepID=UPI00244E4FD2|nr:telomerase-binding protein EST1A [Condylostylus longicornis]
MASPKSKYTDESHMNVEYLPLRIQTKIKCDIENCLENQSSTSACSQVPLVGSMVGDLKSKNSTKSRMPGIISVLKEKKQTQTSESDYSDDSIDMTIKKSPVYSKRINTINDIHWMTHAENILENDNKGKNFREVYERFSQIVINESYLEQWNLFNQFRSILMTIAVRLFENDWKFYCEQNLDSFFWKTLFYNVLQFLKFKQKILKNDFQSLKKKSLQIVEEGFKFYKSFISVVENKFTFKIEFLLSNNTYQQKINSLLKVSIQKLFLNLGDLHRYQAILETNNFNEAKKYYTQAQKLIPENGVPYNQLAIISLSFNNYFDAVYYHIRSLSASNPIISAKESLKILLDEIRKKYDNKFQNIQDTILTLDSSKREDPVRNFRKEIWIHPNGKRKLRFQSESLGDLVNDKKSHHSINEISFNNPNKLLNFDQEDLGDSGGVSKKEQKREFIHNYLYVVSKIYVGVNMETFENAMFRMLYQFNNVISQHPTILSRMQLLEIIAINIFLYEYSKKKSSDQQISITEQQVQNYAYTVGLLMFGITITKANDILKEFMLDLNNESTENFNFSQKFEVIGKDTKPKLKNVCDHISSNESLECDTCRSSYTKEYELKLVDNLPVQFIDLLQSIKIWCNWLTLNLFLCKSPIYYQQITPWKNFANLLTSLAKIFKHLTKTIFMEKSLKSPLLEEDFYLLGFGPLKKILPKSANCNINDDKEYSAVLYRIRDLFQFGVNNLCSNDLSILNVEQTCSGDLVFTKNLKTFNENQSLNILGNVSSDKEAFNESDEHEDPQTAWKEKIFSVMEHCENFQDNFSEFNNLKNRKIMLERSNKAQELYKEKLKNVLEDAGSLSVMEVRPKYLVPDTNCFIDFLDELEYLVTKHNSYVLMVPLVVINELEGLMKGFKIDSNREMSWKNANSRIHHFDEVARISEASLNFIKNFNRFNIRCCTSRGSILKNSSAFTFEENDDNSSSNDDKILASALSIATESYIKRSEKSYLHTEVVLLTTDRNLRVKALAKNIAVSDLTEFLNWIEEKDIE